MNFLCALNLEEFPNCRRVAKLVEEIARESGTVSLDPDPLCNGRVYVRYWENEGGARSTLCGWTLHEQLLANPDSEKDIERLIKEFLGSIPSKNRTDTCDAVSH